MRMGETSSTTDFSASGIANHSKGRFEKLTGHSCQVEGSYEVSPNKTCMSAIGRSPRRITPYSQSGKTQVPLCQLHPCLAPGDQVFIFKLGTDRSSQLFRPLIMPDCLAPSSLSREHVC